MYMYTCMVLFQNVYTYYNNVVIKVQNQNIDW